MPADRQQERDDSQAIDAHSEHETRHGWVQCVRVRPAISQVAGASGVRTSVHRAMHPAMQRAAIRRQAAGAWIARPRMRLRSTCAAERPRSEWPLVRFSGWLLLWSSVWLSLRFSVWLSPGQFPWRPRSSRQPSRVPSPGRFPWRPPQSSSFSRQSLPPFAKARCADGLSRHPLPPLLPPLAERASTG